MAEKVGSGLTYWSKIWTQVVEENSIPTSELSYLLSNSNSVYCPPCSRYHEKGFDHCLHCEELLQLTVVHILLLRAESDEGINKLVYLLVTEHNIWQKLVHRILAPSAYISHVTCNVLVSLITLNTFEFFTKEHFEELLYHLLGSCQSKDKVSTTFRLLNKMLKAKLIKEYSEICLNLIDQHWMNILIKFKEYSSENECNSEFLKLWKTLIKKHGFICDTKLQTCDTAQALLKHMDYLIARLDSNSTNGKWVLKSTLQLFNKVLSYKEELAIQKHIPHFYLVTCQHLLAASIFGKCLQAIADYSSHDGFGGSEEEFIFRQDNSNNYNVHGGITSNCCISSNIDKDSSPSWDITADISDKAGICSDTVNCTNECVANNGINIDINIQSDMSCSDISYDKCNISNSMSTDYTSVRIEEKTSDRNITDVKHKMIVEQNNMESSQDTTHIAKDSTFIGNITVASSIDTRASKLPNLSLLRRLILLQVNTYVITVKHHDQVSEQGAKMDLLNKITSEMQHTCSEVEKILSHGNKMGFSPSKTSTITIYSPEPSFNLDWLPEIFSDQDDSWIEILLAVTDLYVLSKAWYETESSLNMLSNLVNPHKLFIQLLKSMAFDHCVLLDLLTSPETCFLLYFLKYLKLVSQEWCIFVQLHKEYSYVAEYNTSNYSNLLIDDSHPTSLKEETEKHDMAVCLNSASKISYEMKINAEKPQCFSQFSFHCESNTSEPVFHKNQIDLNESSLLSCNKHLNEGKNEKIIEQKSSLGLSWIQMYSDSEEESVSENSSPNIHTTFGDYSPVYSNITHSYGDSSVQNVHDISLPDIPDKNQNNEIKEFSSATTILKSHTSINTNVQKSNKKQKIEKDINKTGCQIDLDTVSHIGDSTSQKLSGDCSNASVSGSGALDQTLGCLIRLQLSLERLNRSEMFPYNPEKLIQALQHCIFLYES